MQMKAAISLILFIFLRCHFGSALNCYSCSGECKDKSTAPCKQGELCGTLESVDGKIQGRQMSCVNQQYCTNNSTLSMVQKCCDKDLCNDPNAASTNAKPGADDHSRDSPLQCYACSFGCMDEKVTTCKEKEVCVIKTGKFAGSDTHKRGCANTTVCNTETPENMMGTSLSAKNWCCDTNLCNSAAHLKVPAIAILAAIVAVWIH